MLFSNKEKESAGVNFLNLDEKFRYDQSDTLLESCKNLSLKISRVSTSISISSVDLILITLECQISERKEKKNSCHSIEMTTFHQTVNLHQSDSILKSCSHNAKRPTAMRTATQTDRKTDNIVR